MKAWREAWLQEAYWQGVGDGESDRIAAQSLWKRTTVTEFDRISHDPKIMGGKPTIRGMRVTVGTIVGLIGVGRTIEQVLTDYPYLEREDVLQALRYATSRFDPGSDFFH